MTGPEFLTGAVLLVGDFYLGMKFQTYRLALRAKKDGHRD